MRACRRAATCPPATRTSLSVPLAELGVFDEGLPPNATVFLPSNVAAVQLPADLELPVRSAAGAEQLGRAAAGQRLCVGVWVCGCGCGWVGVVNRPGRSSG